MTVPRAAVIILNWNGGHMTSRLVQQLAVLSPDRWHIIVVDNGSMDDSVAILRTFSPRIEILELGTNQGFAAGNNAALRHLLTDHPEVDVIALLNNDVSIEPDALQRAADIVRAQSNVGLLTGLLHDPLGKVWYAGGSLRSYRGAVAVHYQGQPVSRVPTGSRDVTFVSLAFALFPRAVLVDVGLLDEDFFFGQEEWDYSARVAASGRRLVFEPSIRCIHGGDGSHDNSAIEYIYNGYRNKYIYQSKHLDRSVFPLWSVIFHLYARVLMPRRVSRLHPRLTRRQLASAACLARRDYYSRPRQVTESDLLTARNTLAS